MKEIKHLDGGRNYFGDDFLTLQKEQTEALESILQPYGNVVLNGCEVTDSNLKSGICFLDGKVRRVPAMDKITLPAYIIAKDFEEGNRPYEIGGDKSAYKVFGTEVVQVAPADNNYIKIETDGSSKKLDNSLLDKIRNDISNLENEKANKTYVNTELSKKVNLSNRTDSYTDSSTSKWVSALGIKKLYDWVVGKLGTKYDKKSRVEINDGEIVFTNSTNPDNKQYIDSNSMGNRMYLGHKGYDSSSKQVALFFDDDRGTKMGIRNSEPTEALDVNGNIKVSGVIKNASAEIGYNTVNIKSDIGRLWALHPWKDNFYLVDKGTSGAENNHRIRIEPNSVNVCNRDLKEVKDLHISGSIIKSNWGSTLYHYAHKYNSTVKLGNGYYVIGYQLHAHHSGLLNGVYYRKL